MTLDHGLDQGMVGFGGLLRRRRLAAGLTQVDLAARAGVGVRTVRDLERGRSSRPQRTTVELLAGALGLVGRDRADFFAAARGPVSPPGAGADGGAIAMSVPDPVASDGRPSLTRGLPAPGHLIGRNGDVTEIADLVVGGHASVVSLVGLAGVGRRGSPSRWPSGSPTSTRVQPRASSSPNARRSAGAITLLPRERALIGSADLGVPMRRRRG